MRIQTLKYLALIIPFGSGSMAFAQTTSIDFNDLDGSNGFAINGVDPSDYSGYSISSAGDFNGDGFDDVIIGSRYRGRIGESYVVFGSAGGFATNLELASLDGSNGFAIHGVDTGGYFSGPDVSSAGDVNGDGFDDVIIGAATASPGGRVGAGESHIVFGAPGGFAASLELASLDGNIGFVINGVDENDGSGLNVSSAGDVNGDGFDDVIVGARNASPDDRNRAGETYIVFGKAGDFSASFELASLDGSNGFVINGVDDNDSAGSRISSAGDINGDGFDDVIIGAPAADVGFSRNRGESYVVFGAAGGFSASLELASLDGSNGFVISGIDAYDHAGDSVSSAGDVNGDGFDDVIIGAPNAEPDGIAWAGESYVVFGAAGGFAANLELASLDGRNGFVIYGDGRSDKSGHNVSSAGDVNGDGFEDVVVGTAPSRGPSNYYIVFGGDSSRFPARVELVGAFKISGRDKADWLGDPVSSAGDINGDGFDDLIIGSEEAGPGGRLRAGTSYVVLGSADFGYSPRELEATAVANEFDGQALGIGGLTLGVDRFIFFRGTSTTSETDIIRNISAGDAIDLFALGLAPDDVDFRVIAGGTILKLFTGNDPNDFQLHIELNGLATDEILELIVYGDSSTNGTSVPGTSTTQISTIAPNDLDGSNGFVINGVDLRDQSGGSVSSAGDINGDGFDDVVIGAALADPNGRGIAGLRHAGESYILFGTGDDFAPNLDLASLDGRKGFVINGIDIGDGSGGSVSSAGDVNNDGVDDVIIGAPGTDPTSGRQSAGASYVLFGAAAGFAGTFDLSSLDGRNGFVVNGIKRNDRSGESVSSAGDFNSDGFDDIMIGASSADNAGASYLVFGAAGGYVASLELASLDGGNGFAILGVDSGDSSGESIASAGDVNGDGFDDVVIGAPDADPGGRANAGESYLLFGTANGFAESFELDSLDGRNGFVLNGVVPGDHSGSSVSAAGDINGDGFDDVIIGAVPVDPYRPPSAGESYVVFGKSGGFAASLDLASLDGSNGFVITGVDSGDFSGSSVSSAGDVNGDGFDDVIIGASKAGPNGVDKAGESYIIFGGSNRFPARVSLAEAFRIEGRDESDESGGSVSSAGDLNGDGFDDVIIGARLAGPGSLASAGESYIVFGSSDLVFASSELVATTTAEALASTLGSDRFIFNVGTSTSSAIDTIVNVTADDILDLSALDLSPDDVESRLIAGGTFLKLIADSGTNDFQLKIDLNGLSVNEILGLIIWNNSGTNENTVLGTSGDDVLLGTDASDVIDGRGGFDKVWESEGNDRISLSGGTGQMNYLGVSGDYNFTSNIDGTVSVSKPEGGMDTLSGVTGVWFNEERAWYAISRLVDQNPEPPTPPTGGDNRIVATAAQETLRGTAANDTFVFAAGTSTGQALDTLTGWATGDTIDLSGLGVIADDIETRIVAGGTVLKLIEGFGANDFQLKINIGGNNSQEVIDSITVQGGSNTGTGGNVINASAAADILIATDSADRFVFGVGSSTTSAIDTVLAWAPGDTIDLSALGLSASDIDTKTVAGGTILKIIEGFGAGDFQLKVHLNGYSVAEVMGSVTGLGN